MNPASRLIGTILRHDQKDTSYKFALIRAINDVVLSFPDLPCGRDGVAIPLRSLAEYWIAYYWPFVAPDAPVLQGPLRRGRQDIAFRSSLSELRATWERIYGPSRASDGYALISELRNPRIASLYRDDLRRPFERVLGEISRALEQPIRYAGEGQHGVFARPQRAAEYTDATPLPGTTAKDRCVLLRPEVYRAFAELSLWIEALCIHEWSLFTERQAGGMDRGEAYMLFTHRIENRRPLTWERNQIELLMLEGRTFTCQWSKRPLRTGRYDLDHIIPIAVYPTNELWNLVPADPYFNQHRKRARMPTAAGMHSALPALSSIYDHYRSSDPLRRALEADLTVRFDIAV